MRLVLDTNVLIAALVARGVCAELLEHCVRQHEVVTSEELLGELVEKLVRKFKTPRGEARETRALFESRFTLVMPLPLEAPICRDPDDDVVIATALSGRCRAIVTGDRDLLDLGTVRQVRVFSPRDFWRFQAGRRD